MRSSYLAWILGVLLLVFVAPWAEVRVDRSPGRMSDFFIRASGLESARGGFTFSLGREVLDYRPAKAPLLWGYVASVAVGLLAMVSMRSSRGRRLIVGLSVASATAFLGVQASERLPLLAAPPEIGLPTARGRGAELRPDAGGGPRLVERLMPAYYLTWAGVIAACALAVGEFQPDRGYDPRRR